MKKTFNRFCFFTLITAFFLCLSSCSNFFSKNDDDTVKTTATFTGYINIDSILGSDFVISDNTQRSARPAPITVDGTTYEYNIQALRTKNEAGETDGITTANADTTDLYTEHCFELSGLAYGEWKIDVEIRKKADGTVILSDTYTAPLSSSSPSFKHDFFLSPETDGTGIIDLTMNVPSTVAKLDVTVLEKPEGTTLVDDVNILQSSGPSFVYRKATSGIKPGIYKLRFTFKNAADTVVFETQQSVNVLNSLTTNKWVGSTSALIKSDGTFELTQALITAWQLHRTEYYVGVTGALDTNYGSQIDPLATVKHAIALVNDIDYGGTEVKIHVSKGHTEELSSQLEIKSGKKVLIDVWDKAGETTAPKILRQAALGGAMIKTLTGSELTIDGITIDGASVNSAGNCGIYNEGSFTLKSGTITKNFNTSTTSHGAGIYNAGTLNLFGGSITGNQMLVTGGLGGGIYLASGTINLKGVVTIKENSPSNLYLASGSKITITGPLEEGTNKTEIYISTENSVTKEHPVTFTNNYGFYGDGYNAGKFPGRYFIGENATVTYKHATDVSDPLDEDGEAQLAVSSGQIIDPLSDIDVTFSLSKNKFMEGSDASEALRTIKIIPKYVINSAPLSGTALETALAETNWKINMYVGDKPITGCSWTDPTIVIPATVTYHDTYTLVVRASYKGITFDQEFVINDPSPFVQTPACSWTGSAEEVAALTSTSNVFIAGRTLNIPSLIACDHEVTQGEYEKYMTYYGVVRNNERMPNDTYGIGENYPAYYVCWYEAVMYCNLRSEAEGLTPAYYLGTDAGGSKITSVDTWASLGGQYYISKTGTGSDTRYYFDSTSSSSKLNYNGPTDTDGGIQFDETANGWRLPTEIEWEYLARGENSFEYSYSGSNSLAEVGWYTENSGGKTHVVKSKESNSLGLYDMSGNVWEWCWDIFATSLSISAETPSTGPESGSGYHSIRGCSFNSSETPIADRNHSFDSGIRYSDLGFRVVRTITE